jgi:hypothetical protein
MIDHQTIKNIYNRCNPEESLSPNDARYVNIDEKGDDQTRLRGRSWVDHLQENIELSNDPIKLLFTGLPGSGKSTELIRLKEKFKNSPALFFPILINADDYIDLSNTIDVTDIISAIVYAVEQAILSLEGKPTNDDFEDGWTKNIKSIFTDSKLEGSEIELNIPWNLGKIKGKFRTDPSFREKIRQAVGRQSLRAFLQSASEHISSYQERMRKVHSPQHKLVIIFDTLEKLRGFQDNWLDVLTSAERVFGNGAPYLDLPVHIIYTVPPALATRIQGVYFMPMVKVKEPDGTRYEPGFNAMWEIVKLRIGSTENWKNILGDQYKKRTDRLIELSGGYPRDLIRLMRQVLMNKPFPLSDAAFERLCGELISEYRRLVPENAFDWLAQVACDKYLTIQDDEHSFIVDRMIQLSVVFHYLNNQNWYDIHPVVALIPGVKDAIQKRRTISQTPPQVPNP